MQRVTCASVTVGGETVGEIEAGLVVLLAIAPHDTGREVAWMRDKVCGLRIFPDDSGRMNLSLLEVKGEALVVPQFTLYGDARKGKRPSFVMAAQGPEAQRLYEEVAGAVASAGVRCATGVFGAHMDVGLVNDGPVTILLDSDKTF